jgi:hypothetical protein
MIKITLIKSIYLMRLLYLLSFVYALWLLLPIGNTQLEKEMIPKEQTCSKLPHMLNYDVKLMQNHQINITTLKPVVRLGCTGRDEDTTIYYQNDLVGKLVGSILYDCHGEVIYDIPNIDGLKNDSMITNYLGFNIASIKFNDDKHIVIEDKGHPIVELYHYKNDMNLWQVDIYNSNHDASDYRLLGAVIGKRMMNSEFLCKEPTWMYLLIYTLIMGINKYLFVVGLLVILKFLASVFKY